MADERRQGGEKGRAKGLRAGSPNLGQQRGAGARSEGDQAKPIGAPSRAGCFHCDLFGDPLPAKRGRGRPKHEPTAETRRKVRQLREQRATQSTIAAALGLTVPTLVVHYPAELGSSSQAWRTRLELDRAKGP